MMGSMLDVELVELVLGGCLGGRTIGYNDGVAALNSLVGDSFGQVDCQEGRIHLTADGVKGRFEQDWSRSGLCAGVIDSDEDLRPVLSQLFSARASG